MTFQNPVVVFVAPTVQEANLLCQTLVESGIVAEVRDVPDQGSAFWGDNVTELPMATILVEEHDSKRATELLEEVQRLATERLVDLKPPKPTAPISVLCEKCKKESQFPGDQFGTIQLCPFCFAYVDVGDDVDFDDWKTDEPLDN